MANRAGYGPFKVAGSAKTLYVSMGGCSAVCPNNPLRSLRSEPPARTSTPLPREHRPKFDRVAPGYRVCLAISRLTRRT